MKSRNLHHSMTLLAIHEGHFPYLEQQQCMWKDCNSLSPLHSNKATYNSCMGSEVGKLLKYLRNGITMNSSSFTLYNSAKLGCQENDSRFHPCYCTNDHILKEKYHSNDYRKFSLQTKVSL